MESRVCIFCLHLPHVSNKLLQNVCKTHILQGDIWSFWVE